MKKNFLTFSICFFSLQFLYGQFIVSNEFFQPTGVSNQGDVVGYTEQAGPYLIWKPESSVTVSIGGLAPGQGIGGQASFSDNGQFLCGTSAGALGAEMSIYDQAINQWSVVGSLGFVIDNTAGGGFGISGDGNTVVGLSWADNTNGSAYAHAVAWNQTEGIMDLGSIFDNIQRSTRANAVSADGKVVVGWQDFNGPWKSAVWRKNPAGGYFPNEYLLVDSTASESDEFNQLGECSVVSSDGVWIGGYGDYANFDQPWIWSRPTGVINLGSLPNTGRGFVSGINADGTIVVGWYNGAFFGDPQTPFIWTPTSGVQNLNTYIETVLGIDTGPIQVSTVSCMSSNGKYLSGYGVDTTNFGLTTYRLSTTPAVSVAELESNSEINIFPNPFISQTTIMFLEEQKNTNLKIIDITGKEVYSHHFSGKQLVLPKDEMKSGVYFLQFIDENKKMVSKKIIIQ